MSRPVLYLAITNHGFGHAVRAASVAAAVQQLNPEILLILVTTAPRWLLASYIPGDFIHRPRAFDVGAIQSDSLTIDRAMTLDKLRHIRTEANALIASEVTFIRQNRVGLILADIPPLVAAIAHVARVPCWMMSNFGWDFIYRDWGGDFLEIADWIGDCYRQCERLFRLPLHEPMSAFPTLVDVGLTGGVPHYGEAKLRSRFGLTAPPNKTVLITFGGLGLGQIPYDNLAQFPDWQFISFDRSAPDLPNLAKVGEHQYRPVDFMPFCGRVISKPGFSTFSEAMRLGTPIVSLLRQGFAESPLLLAGLQQHSHHQIVTPDAFSQGSWDFLHQPLLPPISDRSLARDGSETIAQAVVDFFSSRSDG